MLDDDFVADLLGFANDYHVVGPFDRRFFGISLRHDPVILQEIMAAESSLPDLMTSPEHFLAQLTFEHEMTHWHQQIGTGYGYLQLEAEDCAARSVGSFFESYRRLLPALPTRGHWHRGHSTDYRDARAHLGDTFNPGAIYRVTLEAFQLTLAATSCRR